MVCCTSHSKHHNEWDFSELPEKLYPVKAGECNWKTSHNSFMPWLPIGRATREEVVRVLGNGYRVIEIDIHERQAGLEVSHGVWSNGLALRDVLKDIADNAFKGTDYPLAIVCDSSVKTDAGHQAVEDEFKAQFSRKLVSRMDANTFYETPLHDLKDRVVLVSYAAEGQSGLGNISTLSYGVNGVYNNSINEVSDMNTQARADIKQRTNQQIVRLYPSNVICSDNPDPTRALATGAQWVALNDQTRNKHFKSVNALFKDGPITAKSVEKQDSMTELMIELGLSSE